MTSLKILFGSRKVTFLSLLYYLAIPNTHAQELYNEGNAASTINEADSSIGWTGDSVITSDGSDPFSGNYSLKIASFDNRGNEEGRRASYTFDAVIGDTYLISIWVKPGVTNTSAPAFAGWSGFSGFANVTITNPNWTRFDFAFTVTTTSPIIRVYAGRNFTTGGSTDDYVLVDRISIANQNFPAITNIFPENGNVGIGTLEPGVWKLAVDGKIRAKEIRVETAWADYVFEEGYLLPTLKEVRDHINEKGHLPNIPSAREVELNGVELGEMNRLLLEKVEELTLYILELEDKNMDQSKDIIALKAMEQRISSLEDVLKKD